MIRQFSLTIIVLFASCLISAQNYKAEVQELLRGYTTGYAGRFDVRRTIVDSKKRCYRVMLNGDFPSLAYRPEMVDSMETQIRRIIAPTLSGYRVEIIADEKNIRELIPNYFLPVWQQNKSKLTGSNRRTEPFVRNTSRPYDITRGLQDRNIALWQSHGLYYDQRTDRWQWQRARVMTTVEDKFTLSFVIPYMMPMLERAGANVLLPRERDLQPREMIIDNDPSLYTRGRYFETEAAESLSADTAKTDLHFKTGGHSGFGYIRDMYTDRQNPFVEGTFRRCDTEKSATSRVVWAPDIEESGWYWVSVAYVTTDKSVPDAHYTVHHSAGETHFTVNQRMGGGTWIYLGQFYFEKGADITKACVTLDNNSRHQGEITADAVRFGGGIGNIGRRPAGEYEKMLYDGELNPKKIISCYPKEEYTPSGRARFWEAGRYWLQWAGAPFEVYSCSQSLNDYADDYNSRGEWVNWLNYGSENAPDSTGLGIPIDMAMAFHSDAGCQTDTVIGTLGIYTSVYDKQKNITRFPNGQSRDVSRDLTDLIVSEVVQDIRTLINPQWIRRWMWDKNYSESRRPQVPTMLLELLSHQNFEDMQYGLDPRFKFVVSRAVYKAIVKFISFQSGKHDYVITPLPIRDFAIETTAAGDSIILSWQPTIDSLETSATPDGYIIYTRRGCRGWDNGQHVDATALRLPFTPDTMTSYKVTAVNAGGESLDSEILSAQRAPHGKRVVMIINGFDRVSGPEGFQSLPYAGFPNWLDRGVGDGMELQYVGRQHDFDTRNPWISDDSAGWGQSNSDYEFMPIAGNSHDFPAVHGRSIAAAGFGFVSCSRAAAESGRIALQHYDAVDIILGEQKKTYWGRDSLKHEFATFPPSMQHLLRTYTSAGGALFVSGAHVVTDNRVDRNSTPADRRFVKEVLRAEWRADRAAQNGEVEAVFAPEITLTGRFRFSQSLNDSIYAVESPDALVPSSPDARTVMRYSQNGNSAAVASAAAGFRTIVCGFPFETIETEEMRNHLMRQILDFLAGKPTT